MTVSYSTKLRAPTTASLPDAVRIPSTARSLIRSFSRLSRISLIKLALEWLENKNQPLCAPYLATNRSHIEETEEDYAYQPSETIEEVRSIYTRLLGERGTKRDVIDRILEGDWRRGISLRQLAMLDFKCLEENESCLRWTALKLVEHSMKEGKEVDEDLVVKKKQKAAFPTMRASSFVQSIQREIGPLVKAHYHIHRLQSHNITILRLFICESPYSNVPLSTQRTFTDSARTIYVAFPDSCSFIYISVSGGQMDASVKDQANRPAMVDIASMKRLVLEAVPKALSRPQQRIGLQTTSLTARSLSTIITLRGNGRNNAANGAFSIFADGVAEECPISVVHKDTTELLKERYGLEEQEAPETASIVISSQSSQLKRKRSPLSTRDTNIHSTPGDSDSDIKIAKQRKLDAQIRFGTTGIITAATHKPTPTELTTNDYNQNNTTNPPAHSHVPHPSALNRLHITLDEPLSTTTTTNSTLELPPPQSHSQSQSSPLFLSPSPPPTTSTSQPSTDPAPLKLTFHGTNILAGLRLLTELGTIDAKRMPSWMTGEDAVSVGTVRVGRMVDGMGGGC